MTETPAPVTSAEFIALPEGGMFGCEIREINGKRIRVPVLEPAVAFYVDGDAVMELQDEDGNLWKLGRYADGRWFKQLTYR